MIRPATPEDLPRCATTAAEFYASSKFLRKFDIEKFCAMWTMFINAGNGVIFLLLERDFIAGAIGGVAYPEAYSADLICQEFFWMVGERHRGAGVRLFKKFEEWAREKGCSQIRMACLSDSMADRLDKFYRRAGYEPADINYVKIL